jgi:DNA-binding transcriptional regulator LsrR (DeoR family)
VLLQHVDKTSRGAQLSGDRTAVGDVLATRVARRYYVDEHSKLQIAAEMGISRFKVARLLELARARGIVSITITGPGARDLELADRLRERYGLHHVLVATTTEDDDTVMRRDLGAVAADLLAEITGPHDVLGLGWARSVLEMAAHLRKVNVGEVVQLTGALTRPDVESSATELVRDVARRVGARASVFYAPMIVSDPETARALVRQPPVADAFARFGAVTKAVIGVGGWNPGTSTLSDALTESEREQMVRSRVRADLSGVLLDAGGHATDSPLRDRIIAISAPELRRIPEVIGIAYGLDKVPAALAAIRGHYLDSLVTHTAFAEALLGGGA